MVDEKIVCNNYPMILNNVKCKINGPDDGNCYCREILIRLTNPYAERNCNCFWDFMLNLYILNTSQGNKDCITVL